MHIRLQDSLILKLIYTILLLLLITWSYTHASDLITSKIINPLTIEFCDEPFNPEFEICNINIYDALENEWEVKVIITDAFDNPIFEETVPGVFLGNGSSASPTCVTLKTTNSFSTDIAGNYFITVDVNYVYDINIENDALVKEFVVECGLGSIHGQKFLDINLDGIKDSTEVGVDGVLIKLFDALGLIDSQKTHSMDLNTDGIIDPRRESGLFWFDSLYSGQYIIDEVVPAGWIKTFPANSGFHEIVLNPEEEIDGVLFGNYAELWDFGDLPEPLDPTAPCVFLQCYPTQLPIGARHVATGPMLGSLRDSELDGQQTYTADGDDTTGVDDEDGVEFITFLNGSQGKVRVTVSGGADDFPAFLSGWIDFDGDGFLKSGNFPTSEQIIISTLIIAAGVYDFTFTVPENVSRGGFARFRISTEPDAVAFPYGAAIDGEVEDYVAFGLDYGDANQNVSPINPDFPYGYPVKTLQNGARHVIVPTLRLGEELIDNEQDGIPSYYSNGDDNDNREDENGIAYGPEFVPFYVGPDPDKPSRNITIYGAAPGMTVSITPLATEGGLLNLWIDWNRDGDWKDDNEQVFDDKPIISGPNYTTLSFTIPNNAAIGYTYARYRFSTQIGLEYYGGAPNGEVEDHLLMIDPTLTSTEKKTDEVLPTEYKLNQNYPNPFNPTTRIKYSIPIIAGNSSRSVTLKVLDVLGREITTLVNKEQSAGNYEISFDASSLTSGVYYYQLKTSDFIMTKKMLLLK